MALFDTLKTKGGAIGAPYILQAESPLDPRLVLDDYSQCLLLSKEHGAYDGMIVFCKDSYMDRTVNPNKNYESGYYMYTESNGWEILPLTGLSGLSGVNLTDFLHYGLSSTAPHSETEFKVCEGTSWEKKTLFKVGDGLKLNDFDGGTPEIVHTNNITAGTVSGTPTSTLAFGGEITIPSISYDEQGHITGTSTTTLTLPEAPTDTKVTQTNVTPSSSAEYRLLLGGSTDTTETTTSKKSSKFTADPYTGTLSATTFKGELSGNVLNYGECDTTVDTVDKVVTISNLSLKAGTKIIVKFVNGLKYKNNLTLNLNGTGAHPIYCDQTYINGGNNEILWGTDIGDYDSIYNNSRFIIGKNGIAEFIYTGDGFLLFGTTSIVSQHAWAADNYIVDGAIKSISNTFQDHTERIENLESSIIFADELPEQAPSGALCFITRETPTTHKATLSAIDTEKETETTNI